MLKIRLVGITPLDKEKNYLKNEQIPEKFKVPNNLINWTFSSKINLTYR